MNTQVLEYLIAISEEHSLTRAAERFYLSQPSLSHHLSVLERELGVKLFRREGRTLQPTREGIIVINSARAILHAQAQAQKRIQALEQEARPRLRLCGCLPRGGQMEALARETLRESFPQMELVWTPLTAAQARSSLDQDQQDLALLLGAGDLPPGCQVLWEDTLRLALPVSWGSRPLPGDLGDLCYFQCRTLELLEDPISRQLQETGLAPRLTALAPDLDVAAALVGAGHGVAFLPGRILERDKDKVRPLEGVPGLPACWGAVLRRDAPDLVAQAAQAVIRELKTIGQP